MKTNSRESLLDDFQPSTYEAWKEAAEKLLKGAPFEKKLLTKTPEGITLQPIYNASDIEGIGTVSSFPAADSNLRGTRASGYRESSWEIAQEIAVGDPGKFNENILDALMRGQNALNITFDIASLNGQDPDAAGKWDVGACGLSVSSLEDLDAALHSILPDAVSFHLQSGCAGLTFAALFKSWLDTHELEDNSACKGSFNCDPMAMLASSGTLPTSIDQAYDEMAATIRLCQKDLEGFRAIGVSSLPFHQAGATAVDELACLLATALEYIKKMHERGLSVDETAAQIRFSVSIGGNFFMELSKLRAFRVLWARVVKELGGTDASGRAKVHGRTGLYNKTRLDPYVNLLRTTTEALCGVTGGLDSICVGNFDECIRTPDNTSIRHARNTQIILKEECELTAVADPAGGSWFIEYLTDELGKSAWSAFQEIEQKGGMLSCLEKSILQNKLAASHAQNEKLLAQRRAVLVGTNNYPNTTEKPLESKPADYSTMKEKRSRELENSRISAEDETDLVILDILQKLSEAESSDWAKLLEQAFLNGATLGEVSRSLRSKVNEQPSIQALPSLRLSAAYEKLRNASRAYAKENGHGPKLFLVTLGKLRRHKPRADFTRAFFETGGFEVIYPNGFNSPEEALEALMESGADAAVLCGHDEDYAAMAEGILKKLKEAKPDLRLILAGDPGEQLKTYQAAGMDSFITIRSNNFETNHALLQQLGAL